MARITTSRRALTGETVTGEMVVSIELTTKDEIENIRAILFLGAKALKRHEYEPGDEKMTEWARKFYKAYERITKKGQ